MIRRFTSGQNFPANAGARGKNPFGSSHYGRTIVPKIFRPQRQSAQKSGRLDTGMGRTASTLSTPAYWATVGFTAASIMDLATAAPDFFGGRWNNGAFNYNTAVTNVAAPTSATRITPRS
jgi:hypothetical protein